MQKKIINSVLSQGLKKKRTKSFHKPAVRYSFKFASIISPGSIQNMSLKSFSHKNKIYVKQSYVFLTWMSYVRESEARSTKKESSESDDNQPSFFIFPINRSRLTFLKAPMAHKTFSQEQFVSQFYTMSISFNNRLREGSTTPGVANSTFLALKMRSELTPFETNLIFLKKSRCSISVSDQKYMSINYTNM